MSPDQIVRQRSAGVCEALVGIEGQNMFGEPSLTWTRCGRHPVEVHHRLTRGRGGDLLDAAGETYHLIALCPKHHRMADGAIAYDCGLLLEGQMCRDGDRVYYSGPDAYLSKRYPPKPHLSLVGEEK